MVRYQTLDSKNDKVSSEIFFLFFANFSRLTAVNVFTSRANSDSFPVFSLLSRRTRQRNATNDGKEHVLIHLHDSQQERSQELIPTPPLPIKLNRITK